MVAQEKRSTRDLLFVFPGPCSVASQQNEKIPAPFHASLLLNISITRSWNNSKPPSSQAASRHCSFLALIALCIPNPLSQTSRFSELMRPLWFFPYAAVLLLWPYPTAHPMPLTNHLLFCFPFRWICLLPGRTWSCYTGGNSSCL